MKYSEKLKRIAIASGLPQEQLANKLDVSFPTLNSWINERSLPRKRAAEAIDHLYFDIVGSTELDLAALAGYKNRALGCQMSAGELVTNKRLLNKLTLHLTYHTNTIEGSTMTISDVEDVVFDNKVLSNRTAVEQMEARNHQAALHWLIDQLVTQGKGFQITLQLISDINLRLMNGIISNAGIYRNHTVRIMGSRVTLANWVKIPDLMSDLVDASNSSRDDLIVKMAQFHARFEQIHPFSDGNGRTGRLLMLAQALQAELTPPIVAKERKHAYYKYLEMAQTAESPGPLELFIAESLVFADNLLRD